MLFIQVNIYTISRQAIGLVILLLLSISGFSQKQDVATGVPKFFYTGKTDSVMLYSFVHHSKETSTLGSYEEKDREEITGKVRLSSAEIHDLNSHIKSENSFQHGQAAIDLSNFKIDYYLRGTIIQSIAISTMTRDIIIRSNCRDKKSNNASCDFKKRISKYFENYFSALIEKKHLWNKKAKFGT